MKLLEKSVLIENLSTVFFTKLHLLLLLLLVFTFVARLPSSAVPSICKIKSKRIK